MGGAKRLLLHHFPGQWFTRGQEVHLCHLREGPQGVYWDHFFRKDSPVRWPVEHVRWTVSWADACLLLDWADLSEEVSEHECLRFIWCLSSRLRCWREKGNQKILKYTRTFSGQQEIFLNSHFDIKYKKWAPWISNRLHSAGGKSTIFCFFSASVTTLLSDKTKQGTQFEKIWKIVLFRFHELASTQPVSHCHARIICIIDASSNSVKGNYFDAMLTCHRLKT